MFGVARLPSTISLSAGHRAKPMVFNEFWVTWQISGWMIEVALQTLIAGQKWAATRGFSLQGFWRLWMCQFICQNCTPQLLSPGHRGGRPPAPPTHPGRASCCRPSCRRLWSLAIPGGSIGDPRLKRVRKCEKKLEDSKITTCSINHGFQGHTFWEPKCANEHMCQWTTCVYLFYPFLLYHIPRFNLFSSVQTPLFPRSAAPSVRHMGTDHQRRRPGLRLRQEVSLAPQFSSLDGRGSFGSCLGFCSEISWKTTWWSWRADIKSYTWYKIEKIINWDQYEWLVQTLQWPQWRNGTWPTRFHVEGPMY